MNMVREVYVRLIGLLVSFAPVPKRIENFLLWPLATRILGADYSRIVRLVCGLRLEVGMDDALNRTLLFKGERSPYVWEPSTMRLVELLSRDASAIFMAGSHIGYTALMAAKETSGSVVTCEPVTYLHDRSKKNLELNVGRARVTLHKCALGEKAGTAEIYVSNIRSSIIPYSKSHEEGRKERVEVSTIDAIAKESSITRFDLIFLDVEGYELFALRGAQAVLASMPDLILEVCPRILARSGQSEESLYDFLHKHDYDLYIIADEYRQEASMASPKVTLIPLDSIEGGYGSDYFNILATKRTRGELSAWASVTVSK